MKKLLGLALGIIVALGGFVDVGDLVFATQAGAKFGYSLLWALAIGIVGLIVYMEMCGRVATISKQPVFEIVRRRFPPKLGTATLAGSLAMNVLTCAAEIGGIALILQLLSDFPYRLLILIAAIAMIIVIWVLKFKHIEKVFGYGGLGVLVLAIAGLKAHPQWGSVAHGFLPAGPSVNPGDAPIVTYLYFAVGIIAATLMPYEVYFYSSGALEEQWTPKDMAENRINSIIGSLLGGLAVAGIIVVSALLFLPRGIDPGSISTVALPGLIEFGKAGLLLLLLGMLFSIAGAAVETCFAGAYSLSQYLKFDWGKRKPPLRVPKFSLAWLTIFVLATFIILSGIDPIELTEYAVIFSVLLMPLTYIPIFLAARDKGIMGKFTNGKLANTLGWIYLVVICIVAVAAVPLMVLSNRGQM
jgi:manganese transport protein